MRAFLIECSGDHWRAIGRALKDRHGIKSVLWSGDAATIEAVRLEFTETICIVGVDAACGRLPRQANWPHPGLDATLLSGVAPDEVIALAMMDRMDPASGAFDHDARRRHWHELLRQWGGALDALQPDVVIFSMAPHAIYDYALYALCKHRGVRTCMFERAQLPGYVFTVERFEAGSEALRQAVRSAGETVTVSSPTLREHLAQLRRGGAGALPPNYRRKLEMRGLLGGAGRQKAAGLLRTFGFELMRTAYLALRRRAAPPHYLAHEDREGRLVSSGLAGWLWSRWRGQWKKRALRSLHARLAREVPPDVPYVLLALHFQPERAVVPLAGCFCDQTLMVDLLARSLPPGWLLVVKEHPWQLVPFGRGELGRSAGFYRRIADHANVVLVPLESDTERLLAGARAVATATGSIGWQAIARGVPALVFGTPWYVDAPGVHRISDLTATRLALAAIQKGGAVPAGAAERMLAALESVAVAGFLEPGVEAVQHVSQAEAVAAMTEALAARCRSRFATGSAAA
jgi:hypothetical protein